MKPAGMAVALDQAAGTLVPGRAAEVAAAPA